MISPSLIRPRGFPLFLAGSAGLSLVPGFSFTALLFMAVQESDFNVGDLLWPGLAAFVLLLPLGVLLDRVSAVLLVFAALGGTAGSVLGVFIREHASESVGALAGTMGMLATAPFLIHAARRTPAAPDDDARPAPAPTDLR
ncbi:hypothetical protein Misp01_52680 [Microtetraspora sp. NBRC 13810]|uniref:hypothetical protein n=1 Tax=Microtetraspora sp. NBRC 13810 TaxID=3030990 RepID=UPI00255391E1|nr:hypothetical protein [Microtetraspora sp. NBRC 13810]GLW10139.1 hypothetical protein Misp01_52680 [Microtetraspora sp. NBRC 13810]